MKYNCNVFSDRQEESQDDFTLGGVLEHPTGVDGGSSPK